MRGPVFVQTRRPARLVARGSRIGHDPDALTKSLCKLSQSMKKNFETIAARVNRPRFLCTDCGRAANEKRWVCEPKRIPGSRGGKAGAKPAKDQESRAK